MYFSILTQDDILGGMWYILPLEPQPLRGGGLFLSKTQWMILNSTHSYQTIQCCLICSVTIVTIVTTFRTSQIFYDYTKDMADRKYSNFGNIGNKIGRCHNSQPIQTLRTSPAILLLVREYPFDSILLLNLWGVTGVSLLVLHTS